MSAGCFFALMPCFLARPERAWNGRKATWGGSAFENRIHHALGWRDRAASNP